MDKRASSRVAVGITSPLAGDEPLELRFIEAQRRFEQSQNSFQVEAALECAMLAALMGRRVEAESLLSRARASSPPEEHARVELVSALVMVEAGYPARVAGSLERAESVRGFHDEPVWRALSRLLRAQGLLMEGQSRTAVREALEGLGLLAPELKASPLSVQAHLVMAECLLASKDVLGARVYLDRVAESPGRTGLLAIRLDVLGARTDLARGTPPPGSVRALLDVSLERLERLGAARDLALACMVYAQACFADGLGVPAHWLARAQPLLTRTGTAGDLRQLRQAFRSCGRRRIDYIIDADVFSRVETLRERQAQLQDLLSAQRDARRVGQGEPETRSQALLVDESLKSVQLAEEALIGIVEHTLLDRERISQLVSASQQLSSLEGVEEILAAIPRLASLLLPEAFIGLWECDAGGAPHRLPGGLRPERGVRAHPSLHPVRAPDRVPSGRPGRGQREAVPALVRALGGGPACGDSPPERGAAVGAGGGAERAPEAAAGE